MPDLNQPTQHLPPKKEPNLSLLETQRLRRRVAFWRRMAGVLAGGIAIVLFVAWNRSQVRRRECRASLEHYAAAAQESNLAAQHPDILETQWQSLPPDSAVYATQHYDLIVSNWAIEPRSNERIPVAVCRDSHTGLLSRGRNLLANTPKGFAVYWVDTERADEHAKEAARDNQIPGRD